MYNSVSYLINILLFIGVSFQKSNLKNIPYKCLISYEFA
jgi:hypothetical protein